MKENHNREIPQENENLNSLASSASHADAELNSAPAFGDAIQAFVTPLIQSALDGPSMPGGPCTWLRNPGRGDPPKGSKPGELAALPTPEIQLEDDTQRS